MRLTRDEENHVSHARLLEILCLPEIRVVHVGIDSNDYGEFLFIQVANKDGTSLDPTNDRDNSLTFYGLGYHDPWGRYVSDYWGCYSSRNTELPKGSIPVARVLKKIEERFKELPAHDNKPTATERLAIEVGLHDDVDGFLSSCDDLCIDLNALEGRERKPLEKGALVATVDLSWPGIIRDGHTKRKVRMVEIWSPIAHETGSEYVEKLCRISRQQFDSRLREFGYDPKSVSV